MLRPTARHARHRQCLRARPLRSRLLRRHRRRASFIRGACADVRSGSTSSSTTRRCMATEALCATESSLACRCWRSKTRAASAAVATAPRATRPLRTLPRTTTTLLMWVQGRGWLRVWTSLMRPTRPTLVQASGTCTRVHCSRWLATSATGSGWGCQTRPRCCLVGVRLGLLAIRARALARRTIPTLTTAAIGATR